MYRQANVVLHMIDWLRSHKCMAAIILAMYYLLVVLPHEQVGMLTVKIFGSLSRPHYNLLIAVLCFSMIATGCWLLYKYLRRNALATLWKTYLGINIFLIILCFYFLFVINIEAVHFPQYAIFAILCFPFFGNTVSSLTLATIAGAADELYQYLVLTPQKNNYFDFNDIIIDMIGAATGLLILRILGATVNTYPARKWYYTFDFVAMLVLVKVSVILCLMGHIVYFQSDNPDAFFSMIKIPESGFWTSPPGPPAKFHVVRPMEGLIIISILWLLYLPLNSSTPTESQT